MNKIFGVVSFVAGAAIGSAVTWIFVKKKYEQIAQEEIDSVKAVFTVKKDESTKIMSLDEIREEVEVDELKRIAKEAKEKPNVMEYAKNLNTMGYKDYSNPEKESSETDDEDEDEDEKEFEEMPRDPEKPYVIHPNEAGEVYGYDVITLTFFADKILADELNEMVEDVERTVGFQSLTHFGEYEEDSVYVRNDRLKVDYEILLDSRKYTDVLKTMPHPREDL